MAQPGLLEKINKRYNAAKAYRRNIDKDIKLNLSFYLNRQWVTYDPNFNRVIDLAPPKGKPRITANLIMPVVRIEYAKLTKNTPAFTVVATTSSQDDITKAKACSQFLEYKWSVDCYEEVFEAALLWALVAGTGFVKVYYDPSAGPVYNGEALGDVTVDYCSPLEMFIDPFARSLDEASWVIHARVRPVEYIEAKYGVKVSSEQVESLAAIGIHGEFKTSVTEGAIPAALVKEYWERPSAVVPRGRYAVVSGNKVLYESENPYADICPIPFVSMVHIPVPGRLFGDSVVTHLRQVNVAYNKLKSDIVESTTKLTNPPLFAPANAFLKPPEFSPGEVCYYNPLIPGKIDQLKLEPFPPHTMNVLMRLIQERDDISGVNEVSRGIVPRGVRSGDALAHLSEQDEIRLAVTARNYEAMIGKAMTMVLWLAREFYDLPRTIRVLGENSQREAVLFKSEDIPPDADVRVEAGSTLPKSQAREQQFLLGLWDRQIITDPRLVLRFTHYGSAQELLGDIELDTSQAQRENTRMSEGEQVVVEDYHNHMVHLAEHNRYRKTVDFERLPPERRDLFRQHVSAHQQYLMMQGGVLSGAQQTGSRPNGADQVGRSA